MFRGNLAYIPALFKKESLMGLKVAGYRALPMRIRLITNIDSQRQIGPVVMKKRSSTSVPL